jgi:hypothetical protein
MRGLLRILIVWAGLTVGLLALRPSEQPCRYLCWGALRVGLPQADLEAWVAQQEAIVQTSVGYQWAEPDGAALLVWVQQETLSSLTATWAIPPQRPNLGDVLLTFGTPTFLRLETRSVANVRSLTLSLIYQAGDQITFVTIHRLSNDPRQFGEFRIRLSDPVQRISRYRVAMGTPLALEVTTGWRGLARYTPQQQICC